jgi:3-hydroxybutyryl-CoA dehydrogenase
MVGMHLFNPVPIVQLVEVIRALQTTDTVCGTVVSLIGALGKKAHVSKDGHGFGVNCVHEGLAPPHDIDVMTKLGANHAMGPCDSRI